MADYISEVEGQAYMDKRLNVTAWTNASSADRVKAIKMATAVIDRLNFTGEKTDSAQENEFPRYDDSAIPQGIKDACAEIALALLDGVDPELEYENLSMTQHSFANTKIVYDRSTLPAHLRSGVPSVAAWRLLHPYLRDPQTIFMSRGN